MPRSMEKRLMLRDAKTAGAECHRQDEVDAIQNAYREHDCFLFTNTALDRAFAAFGLAIFRRRRDKRWKSFSWDGMRRDRHQFIITDRTRSSAGKRSSFNQAMSSNGVRAPSFGYIVSVSSRMSLSRSGRSYRGAIGRQDASCVKRDASCVKSWNRSSQELNTAASEWQANWGDYS
jgi:hypothetical protein